MIRVIGTLSVFMMVYSLYADELYNSGNDYYMAPPPPAGVVSVTVPPRQERCWYERVPIRSDETPPQSVNVGGAVVGGIIGGVIGHQIGGGSGKEIATVAGAAIGTVAGANAGSPDPEPKRYQLIRKCVSE